MNAIKIFKANSNYFDRRIRQNTDKSNQNNLLILPIICYYNKTKSNTVQRKYCSKLSILKLLQVHVNILRRKGWSLTNHFGAVFSTENNSRLYILDIRPLGMIRADKRNDYFTN